MKSNVPVNSRRDAIKLGAGAGLLAKALGAGATPGKAMANKGSSARLEANKAVVGRWFDMFWADLGFSGTTILKVVDGRIQEESGLDDGVTALQQLGLLRKA